jgi:hypothetical protein
MKLFNKLMSTIFGQGSGQQSSPASASTQASAPAASGSGAGSQAAPAGVPAAAAGNTGAGGSATTSGGAASAAGGAGQQPVDVDAVLTEMAKKNPEKLDYKKSIVDLMKLVGMDSSLSERKELATELGYTGDKNDSAKMNMWLHKEVLKKLAENGGKVPQNLLD